jgi:hypothetical protein
LQVFIPEAPGKQDVPETQFESELQRDPQLAPVVVFRVTVVGLVVASVVAAVVALVVASVVAAVVALVVASVVATVVALVVASVVAAVVASVVATVVALVVAAVVVGGGVAMVTATQYPELLQVRPEAQ